MSELEELKVKLRTFADERDWNKFHFPKNLAAALSVECAELLEHFQWLSETDSAQLSSEELEKVRLEMADVLLYLVRLADKLDIDLLQASRDKLLINASKYPVHLAFGNSKKRTSP